MSSSTDGQLGIAADSPATFPYILVSCLATGAPWSEQSSNISFSEWARTTFGDFIAGAFPLQEQDSEFSTAHPSRNGTNALVKGTAACDGPHGTEAPRVIISVRSIRVPRGHEAVIRSPLPGNYIAKFWIAIRAEQDLLLPEQFGNNRATLSSVSLQNFSRP